MQTGCEAKIITQTMYRLWDNVGGDNLLEVDCWLERMSAKELVPQGEASKRSY